MHSYVVRWGIAQVGFSGHAVFPTLRNDMEDRRLYPRVLDVSYSAIVTVYLSIAIAGGCTDNRCPFHGDCFFEWLEKQAA